jgi:hypothetical protein
LGVLVHMLRGAQGPRAWTVPRPRRWPSLSRPRDWTGTRSRCIPHPARSRVDAEHFFWHRNPRIGRMALRNARDGAGQPRASSQGAQARAPCQCKGADQDLQGYRVGGFLQGPQGWRSLCSLTPMHLLLPILASLFLFFSLSLFLSSLFLSPLFLPAFRWRRWRDTGRWQFDKA